LINLQHSLMQNYRQKKTTAFQSFVAASNPPRSFAKANNVQQ